MVGCPPVYLCLASILSCVQSSSPPTALPEEVLAKLKGRQIVSQTLFSRQNVSRSAMAGATETVKTTASLARCGMLCKETCDAFVYSKESEECRLFSGLVLQQSDLGQPDGQRLHVKTAPDFSLPLVPSATSNTTTTTSAPALTTTTITNTNSVLSSLGSSGSSGSSGVTVGNNDLTEQINSYSQINTKLE